MSVTDQAARAASAAATRAVSGRGRTDKDVNGLIERFGRHPDGYFHARIVVDGQKFYVHRRYGSWLLPGVIDGHEVLKEPEGVLGSILGRELKFALSAKTRPIELAERRRREEEHHAKRTDKPRGHDEDVPDAGVQQGPDSRDADDEEVRPDTT